MNNNKPQRHRERGERGKREERAHESFRAAIEVELKVTAWLLRRFE